MYRFPSLNLNKPAKKVLFLLPGALVFLFTQSGCSISRSISDSISSPFEWSSDSSKSSSDDRDHSYRNDIRDYTDAYVRSNHDAAGLREGVATVARRHGITDWEGDASSYVGIGAGLAKARVPGREVGYYTAALADTDTQRSAIERGYRSVQ